MGWRRIIVTILLLCLSFPEIKVGVYGLDGAAPEVHINPHQFHEQVHASPRNHTTPALYVFGDSMVDSGNNNWLNVPIYAKSNYNPYGKDFANAVPTGRVTNGKNVPDFIAEFLGLPPPTRVKQPNQPPSSHGYTYASAGCGILPETGPPGCLSLNKQVELFEETRETKLRLLFGNELEHHLANSLFFLWIGNNDYLLNYFNASSSSSGQYTPEEFAEFLIENLEPNIRMLQRLGARKIVLFEVAPFGCIPFYVRNNGGKCVESKNYNAQLFNQKLHDLIYKLSLTMRNPYMTVGKAFNITYDAILNPSEYGFANVESPCCKIAKLFGQELVQCLILGTTCPNREEYLFWDNAHPTEAGHGTLARACINNSSICHTTIEDLAQITINNPASLYSDG